jgi:hypothetical protein
MVANGYWEIEVEETGEYEISLRRWPRETNRAIRSGIEGDDITWCKEWIPEKNWSLYSGGNALDIREASLKIGDKAYTKQVNEECQGISFVVQLEQGSTHLYSSFKGPDGYEIGAYYVYVRIISR